MENKILYIKISVNGRDFLKCTSTKFLQRDIDSIVAKNFKKGIKLTTSYLVVSEHGEAFDE